MGRISNAKIDDKLAMSLYKEGLGWREIGRGLGGIHPFTVSEYFRKKGLGPHNKVGSIRGWDTKKLDQMMWCGCSIKQASKELGISESTIYKYLRDKRKLEEKESLWKKVR